MQDNNNLRSNIHRKVEEGLDFILNHLQEPLFPRKVMTKDIGYQLEPFNKEALRYYKSSDYNDCRINAYPPYTEYHGIDRTPVSFLMVDLDLKDFGGGNASKQPKLFLEKILRNTLVKTKTLVEIQLFYGQVMAITFISLLPVLF
jgi:hypothetical protein